MKVANNKFAIKFKLFSFSNIVSYSKICTYQVWKTNIFKDYSGSNFYHVRIMKSCKVVLVYETFA
mgnify:CR=1 FL=1